MSNKVIVFDLDGTLLDTLKDLNEASNYALRNLGYKEVTLEETKMFIGNGIKNLIERSLKENYADVEKALALFKDYYFSHFDVYTKPYEGIIELVNYCKSKKYKMAVLSNKAQRPLELLCDKFFNGFFEVIIGDRPDIKKKPSLMGLDIICNHFNCGYNDVIYIGDGDADFEVVKKANCTGIFASYGFRGKEYLKNIGAEIIVDSAYEIIDVLEV